MNRPEMTLLALYRFFGNHSVGRAATSWSLETRIALVCLWRINDSLRLRLRVGEPVTYVQASRLKVTGPCSADSPTPQPGIKGCLRGRTAGVLVLVGESMAEIETRYAASTPARLLLLALRSPTRGREEARPRVAVCPPKSA